MTTEDRTQGASSCAQLGPFVDGELEPTAADAFRQHLVDCLRCQEELHGMLQLGALSAELRSAPRAPAPLPPPVARFRRPAAWTTGALALAVGVSFIVLRRTQPPEVPVLLASLDHRTVSGWPSAAGASAYRPYDTLRGTTATVPPALARAANDAENRGDWRAVGTIALLRHDWETADAALARIPSNPDVLADRGLIRLERDQCDDALEYFDRALTAQPNFAPALFNRALCLRRLSLPFVAEKEFARVQGAAVGGWSAEAGVQRDDMARAAASQRAVKESLLIERRAVITRQVPPDAQSLRRYPSQARSGFYHAVSAAPGVPELRKLLPLARELDAQLGGDVLERRLRMTIANVRPGRAAVAARYRDWVLAFASPPDHEIDEELEGARRLGQRDILLQTYENFRSQDASLERRNAGRAFGDVWNEITFAAATAHKIGGEGQLVESERLLRQTGSRCHDAALAIPCFYVNRELFKTYSSLGRIDDALREALSSARTVRSAGLIMYERQALLQAMEVKTEAGQLAAAHATFSELELREPEMCRTSVYMRETLALGFVQRRDLSSARAALTAELGCDYPLDPERVDLRLKLAMLSDDHEELQRVRRNALALSNAERLTEQERQEMRLLAATAALEQGAPGAESEGAEALRGASRFGPSRELEAVRQQAGLSWTFVALRRGDAAAALQRLTETVRTTPGARCVLGLVRDPVRDGWILLDAYGKASSAVSRRSLSEARKPVLPESLSRAIQDCTELSVVTGGDVPSVGGLLPDSLAWSDRLGPTSETASSLTLHRKLLVADVHPPADLQLPPLGVRIRDEGPDWTILRGAEATPDRTLSELAHVDLAELEVHGWVNASVPDGAALALSEDADRRYALSATTLAQQRLLGHPVVMLGACRSATGSPYRREAWTLPRAFVRAGARAVYASEQDLPDAEIGDFFQGLRRRLEEGASPAAALRDERLAWLSRGRTWVRRVMLFT